MQRVIGATRPAAVGRIKLLFTALLLTLIGALALAIALLVGSVLVLILGAILVLAVIRMFVGVSFRRMREAPRDVPPPP